MYISKVEIENFRNLKCCTVDLRPGLNVLVGRNNVGKSNVVDAIRHALGSSASPGELQRLDKTDFRHEGNVPQNVRVTLTFSGLSEQDRTLFFDLLVPNLGNIGASTARLVFEAQWTTKRRIATLRTGGPEATDGAGVPNEVLELMPVTFLPALRDAAAALTPGYKSRLAQLFRAIADESVEEDVVKIFKDANDALEKQPLIKMTREGVRVSARRMSGSDFQAPSIRASEPDFTRILRTLQLTLDNAPVADIAASGLGYQNILYVATVLAHLKANVDGECPLLIVEEPEAHLHPQLVVLLGESLSNHPPGAHSPQTIATTHSPTFAANVRPEQIVVMTADSEGHGTSRALANAGLTDVEQRALQRMMDVTRSALYFSKATILVEGISEALLLPALAKKLGKDLRGHHVSVVPICGVAFKTFEKLLKEEALGIPVAIISDSDPSIAWADEEKKDWKLATPTAAGAGFEVCARTTELETAFTQHSNVDVFLSEVTLEFDLAAAGPENPGLMASVWESIFSGTPGTLNARRISECSTHDDEVLAVWRGICVAKHSGSKAEFAHMLAAALDDPDVGPDTSDFIVPQYIVDALDFVLARVPSATVLPQEPEIPATNGQPGKDSTPSPTTPPEEPSNGDDSD